jgi:hypothetical protein
VGFDDAVIYMHSKDFKAMVFREHVLDLPEAVAKVNVDFKRIFGKSVLKCMLAAECGVSTIWWS